MPHIHDKIDFTSEVFIVYKNKVLLRKHDKIKKTMGHPHLKVGVCKAPCFLDDPKLKTVKLLPHSKECGFKFMDIKIWLSVGGHIEHDEDPSQAAIREVKEEVGLDVKLFDDEDLSFLNTEYGT